MLLGTRTRAQTPAAATTDFSALSIGSHVAGRPHLRLREDCPVETVLTVMTHNNKRVAGVVNKSGNLQGFLTRSSLLGRLIITPGLNGSHSINTIEIRSMTAGDVMIANPAFLASELSIPDALALMTDYNYRTMPVLEDGGYLVGMADLHELAQMQNASMTQAIESKDSLLSYFMHHESYGHGGSVSMD